MIEKTVETISNQFWMVHWTCRRCGSKWSEPIVQNQKSKPSGHHAEDAYETSLCDVCLDGIR